MIKKDKISTFVKVLSLVVISLFVSLVLRFGLLNLLQFTGQRHDNLPVWSLLSTAILIILLWITFNKNTRSLVFIAAVVLSFAIPPINVIMPSHLKLKEYCFGIRLYFEEGDSAVFFCDVECDLTENDLAPEEYKIQYFEIEKSYYSYKEAMLLGQSTYHHLCCFQKNGSFNTTLVGKILFFPSAVFEKFFYYLTNCFLAIILISLLISWKFSRISNINSFNLKTVAITAISLIVLAGLFNLLYLFEIGRF